jgi:hypothetical protein
MLGRTSVSGLKTVVHEIPFELDTFARLLTNDNPCGPPPHWDDATLSLLKRRRLADLREIGST